MELALAALLVSSFTCAGLLALWAATSPRHWFFRTAVFIGTLSPLLLIASYDPFATFLLSGLTIALGVYAPRYWRNRAKPIRFARPKFSLLDLLLAMTVVAVLIPIAKAIYADNWTGWDNICKLGPPITLTTLLAYWCSTSRLSNRWYKAVIVLLTLLALGVGLHWHEPSFLTLMLLIVDIKPGSFSSRSSWTIYQWSALFGSVFLIASLVLVFISHKKPLFNRAAFTLLLLLTATPSLYCYYRLVTLPPLPEVVMPSPNGYDDLVAAGKSADVRLINFWAETPAEQLVAGLPKYTAAYERAELGLSRSIRIPLQYDDSDYSLGGTQAVRTLTRAFCARAKARLHTNSIDEAIDDYLTAINIAAKGRTGGVLNNWLTSIACSDVGLHELYQAHQRFNAQQCQRIIKSILEIEAAAEPFDLMVKRDQVWSRHCYGMYGHLGEILKDIANEHEDWIADTIKTTTLPRHQAKQQLLLTALAIREYQLIQNKLPQQLQDLVPNTLKKLPSDPFSNEGKPLRYQRIDSTYQLYSIGQNRRDDGGTKPDLGIDGYDNRETGDILLTEVFAPWTPPPNTQPDALTEEGPPMDVN